MVDVVRTTAEAEVAAVFKQVAATRWITSLRSDGRIDVAAVAGRLGGGGHPGAAGFTWEGTEDELLAALRAALTAAPATAPGRRRLARRPGSRLPPIVGVIMRTGAPTEETDDPRPGTARIASDPRSARRAFLSAALRRPGTVGAVVPSSARLAEVLAAVVPREGSPVVVELGPGTGAVSAVISRRLPADGPAPGRRAGPAHGRPTCAAPGRTSRWCPATPRSWPTLLAERGVNRVDAVICGLPWALFDEPTQRAILGQVSQVIGTTGAFTTFAYLHGMTLAAARRFRATLRATFDEVVVSAHGVAQHAAGVRLRLPPAGRGRRRRTPVAAGSGRLRAG